LSHFALI